jgi:membrane protease YdiL (CAAX protease family)
MTTLNAPAVSVSTHKSLIARYPLITFFTLAIACSWLAASPSLLLGVPFQPYQTLGAFGPLLAACIVSAALNGREGVIELLQRMTAWRFRLSSYLLAIFGLVILYLTTILLSGALPIQALAEKWTLIFSFYIPALLTTYLVNPIGEETAWTGFALHHLQKQFRPWLSALILGVVWAVWHLPAYFIPSEMGTFNVFGFVIFMFIAISTRVIWTWITNSAKGSGLAGILLHASSNAVSVGLIPLLLPTQQSSPAEDLSGPILLGLLLLSAVLVLIITRGQLSYSNAR